MNLPRYFTLSLLLYILCGCTASPTATPPTHAAASPFPATWTPIPTTIPGRTPTLTPPPSTAIPAITSTPTAPVDSDGGITVEEDSIIPPIPPRPPTISWLPDNGSVGITWQATGDDTLENFTIYRRENEGEWGKIGTLSFIENAPTFSFTDSTVQRQGTYEYAISATNRYGVESQFSTATRFTVP